MQRSMLAIDECCPRTCCAVRNVRTSFQSVQAQGVEIQRERRTL